MSSCSCREGKRKKEQKFVCIPGNKSETLKLKNVSFFLLLLCSEDALKYAICYTVLDNSKDYEAKKLSFEKPSVYLQMSLHSARNKHSLFSYSFNIK